MPIVRPATLTLATALLIGLPAASDGLAAPPGSGTERPASERPIPLNPRILDELRRMPHDGSLAYVWTPGEHTDGVSRRVTWRGETLAEPDASGGVHCSGVTFEVWVRALATALGDRHGLSAAEILRIKQAWYNQGQRDGGPVDALVQTGLGERVDRLEDLQPGDLVQFWRNNGNGHSAIFVDHTRTRTGDIRGMVFWSAQSSSHGIGRRFVSVGRASHQITPGRLYGVRPMVPAAR